MCLYAAIRDMANFSVLSALNFCLLFPWLFQFQTQEISWRSSAGRRSPIGQWGIRRIESAERHLDTFLPFLSHTVEDPNLHSISHSKTKRKLTSPLLFPQMANSSTILSGPSLPLDHPHKLPTLFSPNTSTKAPSPSTLLSHTPRPTRSVTHRLRRLAAPAQYITHRAPRTPPGQICLPFDYPRFFRINGS